MVAPLARSVRGIWWRSAARARIFGETPDQIGVFEISPSFRDP
jgi:hypothetical protein